MNPLVAFTPTNKIYEKYCEWCDEKHIKKESLSKFSEEFAVISKSRYKKNNSHKDANGKHQRGFEPL